MQELFEMAVIFGNTVCQGALEASPDEFRRVEFGGVTGKAVDMQSRMTEDELLSWSAFVWSAIVPEQHNRSTKVLEKMPEELGHLRGANVLVPIESGIERELFAFGRDRKRGDGGNFMSPPSGNPQDRRLPARGPGANNVGNQQEPAFIEEREMGAKSFGLFLYGATRSVSSEQSPSRPSPAPAFRAFGNSIPGSPSASTGWLSSSESQTASRLHGLPASGSRGRSDSPAPALPSVESLPVVFSGGKIAAEGDLGLAEDGAHPFPASGMPDATAPPNSEKSLPRRRQPDRFCLIRAAQWLSACASPTFPLCHGVSCPIE
jgi:hypothetical protein